MNKQPSHEIKFRKVRKEDLPILKTWRNTNDIWMNNTQYIFLNMKNQEEWFSSIQNTSEREMYLVTLKNQPIAICGFIHIEQKNADIAIIIGEKKFRGKGIGKEILKNLLDIGFKKFHFNRISAEVIDFNKNSRNFFKDMNFDYEATLRQVIWRNGGWHDMMVYSLLKQDWTKN